MFFEGPEKKLEIVFASNVPLRELGREFWQSVVEASKAQILSAISDEKCVAYLLSESSLFVYDNKITMITCGTTTLVSAAELLIEKFGAENVLDLYYQRKNENFPHYQKTHFFDDARTLAKHVKGRALQFGNESSHHIYLFHYTRASSAIAASEDVTLEILMHGLSDSAYAKYFASKMDDTSVGQSGMRTILKGFQVDDFCFDPVGYSLNALKDGKYYTIHVTPQSQGSYVSFETNAVKRTDINDCLQNVLEIFEPSLFDIVVFDNKSSESLELAPGSYQNLHRYHLDLPDGYGVQYFHFLRPNNEVKTAVDITGSILQ